MDPRDPLKKNVSIVTLRFLISSMKEHCQAQVGGEVQSPDSADGVLGRCFAFLVRSDGFVK